MYVHLSERNKQCVNVPSKPWEAAATLNLAENQRNNEINEIILHEHKVEVPLNEGSEIAGRQNRKIVENDFAIDPDANFARVGD